MFVLILSLIWRDKVKLLEAKPPVLNKLKSHNSKRTNKWIYKKKKKNLPQEKSSKPDWKTYQQLLLPPTSISINHHIAAGPTVAPWQPFFTLSFRGHATSTFKTRSMMGVSLQMFIIETTKIHMEALLAEYLWQHVGKVCSVFFQQKINKTGFKVVLCRCFSASLAWWHFLKDMPILVKSLISYFFQV